LLSWDERIWGILTLLLSDRYVHPIEAVTDALDDPIHRGPDGIAKCHGGGFRNPAGITDFTVDHPPRAGIGGLEDPRKRGTGHDL
jgi:hypothetical protein